MEKNVKQLECMACKSVDLVLKTPYNWGLIVATIIVWMFTGWFTYSTNYNFDMVVISQGYIQAFSLVAIIVGVLKHSTKPTNGMHNLMGLGAVTYVFSMLTVVFMKNFGPIFLVGFLFLKPLSIFCFFLLVKHLWLGATEGTAASAVKVPAAKPAVKKPVAKKSSSTKKKATK